MLEPDKLQFDCYSAYVIAQQNSSATFASLHFPTHKEKFSTCFTNSIIISCFFPFFRLIAKV
jgi:hypothetical protein